MRTLINFILILSLAYSNVVFAAQKCSTDVTGRDPYEMVHMRHGDVAVGLYQCTHCDGLRRPTPQGKDNERVCEGCGHPFDSSEPTVEPVFDSRGGQTYVQARFLPLSQKEAQLFKNAGPDWACASCTKRNWGYDQSCTGCGHPREGNEQAGFDPHASKPLSAVKGTPEAKAKRDAEERTSVGSRVKDTRDNLANFVRNQTRGPISERTKKILLTGAVAALMAVGLAWYLVYNYTHPDPLKGEVTDVVKEFYLFKDEQTYLQYKHVILRPDNLPDGVRVLLETDVSLKSYSGPVQRSDGYLVQMTYANVVVGGYHFTVALEADETSSWKKGDSVVVEVEGGIDPKYKRASQK